MSPRLAGFGLPTPDRLTGLALRYQIAQKVHAASDPHDPPDFQNDRARDVVDLLLLRDLIRETGAPTTTEVKAAVLDIFDARARDAASLGYPQRIWPARITPYRHWTTSFERAATSAGVVLTLDDAVAQANAWLDELDASSST